MVRLINYSYLSSINSWPRSLNNFFITGPLKATIKHNKSYKFINNSNYIMTLEQSGDTEVFNQAINNVMYMCWLLKKGYNPSNISDWERYRNSYSDDITSQYPLKMSNKTFLYEMILHHSDLYHKTPLVDGEEEVVMPFIIFDNLYKIDNIYYPRFELVDISNKPHHL